MSKGKFIISEAKPLVKDENVEPVSRMFSYRSVVGIILYLSRNNHTYVALVVNICSQYMSSPKISHELILKILACYLKKTKNRGVVLNSNSDVCKVYAYPDANFSGMYEHEKPTDPACINFADC